MRVSSPLLRFWRVLCATVLVMGLWSSTPAEAMSGPPAWIAAAICHADTDSPGPTPNQHGVLPHSHCAWCQMAVSVLPPPLPSATPLPRLVGLASFLLVPALRHAESLSTVYASRAPPAFG